MIPTARKLPAPKTADLSRFAGQDIVQRYTARMKNTAAFMVGGQEYHIHKDHAHRRVFVVLDRNGVCNVVNPEGGDVFFAPHPQDVIDHYKSNQS